MSFWHGETQILDSVSIDIPAGCVTVLMGPSGAGKTTIADIILGLYAPDRGRVLVDGVPLEEIDLKSWRRLVGYVPQDLVLFHDTIQANVALGDRQIGEAQVRRALQMAGAWEFIEALPDGMQTHVGQGGAKLSGGQRQRIALARALVCQPKLLVLDEVTSALDPHTEQQICANVRRACRRGHGAGDHAPAGAARDRRPVLSGRGRPRRGDHRRRAGAARPAGLIAPPGIAMTAASSSRIRSGEASPAPDATGSPAQGAGRRIALLLPNLAGGGAEACMLRTADALLRRGFRSTSCCASGPGRCSPTCRRACA